MPLLHLLRHLRDNRPLRKVLIAGFCTAILVIVLRLVVDAIANAPPPRSPNFQPLVEMPASAQRVTTGLFAVNLYSLDTSSNTYNVDFYIWFRWKGQIDPLPNLEFINAVDNWSLTKQLAYPTPQTLPDGSSYQVMRVEGRFAQPFALDRYPLDQQQLGITLENSVHTLDHLVYVADTEDSGMADNLATPGWRITGYRLQNLQHRYPSRFGDLRDTAETSTYSSLRFELLISRPVSFFIWKLLLPLMIVLFSTWGALMLNPNYVESRILVSITALLTMVFLQQGYSAGLPDVGYLVLLDKIYALAYLLIVTAILEAIITADWIKTDGETGFQRAVQLDRLTLVGQFVVMVLGVTILILV